MPSLCRAFSVTSENEPTNSLNQCKISVYGQLFAEGACTLIYQEEMKLQKKATAAFKQESRECSSALETLIKDLSR